MHVIEFFKHKDINKQLLKLCSHPEAQESTKEEWEKYEQLKSNIGNLLKDIKELIKEK